MKFKLVETMRYWWPVEVSIPDPDAARAGKFIRQTLHVEFEALPLEEARRINAEFLALETDEAREEHQHDLLRRVCCNWRDVVDEDDQSVAFSPDALNQALRFGWFRAGVYAAYAKSLAGDQARLGN